jgi:hypothetical protein
MSITNDKKNGSKGSNMPAEDLEQYGVWVKAGPETVKDDSSAKDDFELSDISDSNTEITEEEEALLGSLEENSRRNGAQEEDTLGSMDDFSFDEPASPNGGDDDFSFPDIEDIQAGDDAPSGAEGDAAPADEDLFLPEEESLEAGVSGEEEGEKIELDFDLGGPPEDSGADADGFNDIAAVEKEMIEGGNDSLAEPSIEVEVEAEPSIEIEADETGAEPPAADAAELPENQPLPPAAGQKTEEEKPARAQQAETSILSKIEEELASIKSELFELKKELASLRVAGSAEPATAEHHKAAGTDSGFFAGDEDEDETIALTGDELDNILSTADITEETGESDVPDDILNFTADIHLAGQQPEAGASGKLDLDFAETEAAAQPPAEVNGNEDISSADFSAPDAAAKAPTEEEEVFSSDDMEISVEEPEPDVAVPGQELELGDMPDAGQEIEIDMTDSRTEDLSKSFEESASLATSFEDTPAVTESIPLTTPDEQAIIEEYNRELDNFGSADLHTEEAISETIAGEAGVPAGEEEAEIEFDLDSLQQETPEAPQETEIPEEETTPQAFEEGLPEIELPADEAPQKKAKAEGEAPVAAGAVDGVQISGPIREEIRSVLKYMDQLLESLPEDKIQEFAHSEHFDIYRKLFEELELE